MLPSGFTVTPCQPYIGAEIGGVDLTKPISLELADALRKAVLDYQVIVLRDQDVTREQQLAFAKIFARDEDEPFIIPVGTPRIDGYPEFVLLSADGVTKNAADIWHTDECYREKPASYTVLRAVKAPSIGGDTVFSSMVAAYRALPDDIKEKIRDLQAWTSPGTVNEAYQRSAVDYAKFKERADAFPPVLRPVVRIHGETGEPTIFVNERYTSHIEGMDEQESAKLLRCLWDQVKRPDFQMRVRWRQNTITVWDNRSVQHYAVADYNEPRLMERLSLGDCEPARGFADMEKLHEAA